MTIREVIDRVNLNPLMRATIRSTLAALAPGALDASLSLKIDREGERVRLDIGGKPAFEASFDEVESYGANPAS